MEQVDYQELLKRFQYSYTKPNAQLRHYLQSLTPHQYSHLFQNIENLNYDSHKIKRLLRYLKKPYLIPQYFHLKLKHKLKIHENVPEGVVDFNQKNQLIFASQKQGQLSFDKLKEELFVDFKIRKIDSFTFKYQFYHALQDNLTNQCIEQCLRLLKRSKQNMDTLQIVLTELTHTQDDTLTPVIILFFNIFLCSIFYHLIIQFMFYFVSINFIIYIIFLINQFYNLSTISDQFILQFILFF
ncbi:unnamed protein product [Paramecium sonneborni]|uniref:Transmembrane protein n=1 Tax=Paramecium sonneborni TaxID=65129 RepID=A0A8S1R597_9CILI|nr:unnamed protein product [Paramecium sonneborni]